MADKTWQLAQARAFAQYQKNLKDIESNFKYEMTRNIEHIYCAALIVFSRYGHTEDECQNFIMDIQELWTEVANDPTKDIKSMCRQETGFDIEEKQE